MMRLLALGAVLLLAACRASDLHPDSLASAGVSKADNATPVAPVDTVPSYFGIYDPETRMEYFADPLYGRYERHAWVADSSASKADAMRVAGAFPLRRPLAGLDSTGASVFVVLDSVPKPSGDLYVGAFAAHLEPNADSAGPVLFWTGPLAPRAIRPTAFALTPEISAAITRVTDSLFQLALREREPMEGAPRISIRDARALSVAGADSLLVVRAHTNITERAGSDPDDRGGVFMILSRDGKSVRYARFGHPEWSPNATTVIDIEPILFFTLPGDSRILMFSTYQGPWEDNGYGILDLASGHPLAR